MANPRRQRPVRTATVTRTEQLTPQLVRVHLAGDDLRTLGVLENTDSYIKILFPAPGADYAWPFDPDEVTASRPPEQWPVTRTYTIRHHDPTAGTMAVDFVVHGDEGIAGPWARDARPGDQVAFRGPGGGWAPTSGAHHLLVGDESAAPAIAAALDLLPDDSTAEAWVEVEDETSHVPLRTRAGIEVHWVHRDEHSGAPGEVLAGLADEVQLPDGEVRAFVHGNADMIKRWRRRLLVEAGLPREHASISGYWRTGRNEDDWQASKREFVAQMEAEQGL